MKTVKKWVSLLLILVLICLSAGCSSVSAQAEVLPAQPLSDQELIDRALYLLDPYVLPVSWWIGAGYDFLTPADSFQRTMIQPHPNAPMYFEILRFQNMEELKQVTEQLVTKEYAETYLYPRGESYFLEQDGTLYLSAAACTGHWEFSPVAANVISKTDTFAELSVTLGTIYDTTCTCTIYLQYEDQTWKLANTPFTPEAVNVKPQEVNPQAIPTDEQLTNRLLSLMDRNVYPTPWFCGAGDDALGTLEIDYEPLPDTPEYTTFFEVSRFRNLQEFDRAVEQVFTHQFAETYLYPLREKNQDYLMRDGKLYRNTSLLGSGWGASLESVKVVKKTADTAELACEFSLVNTVSSGTAILKKENGLWKIDSLPDFMVPQGR